MPIIPQIRILYSCLLCGIKDASVLVDQREDAEDIKDWMEKVTYALCQNHDHRSPHCKPSSLSEVKIPISKDETAPIGQLQGS